MCNNATTTPYAHALKQNRAQIRTYLDALSASSPAARCRRC